MKKYIAFLFAALLFLPACSVYKADSNSLSSPDYNQRVTVYEPHYDKVITPIGVGSIAASTAGGAYLGYQSNLIKFNSGTEQKTSQIGNAVIGAAVGFGTSYLMNRLFGLGKKQMDVDYSEWVKKANKNFLLVPGTGNLTVIPKNADANYQIQNTTDAIQFKSVFNASNYTDNVFKTGIANLYRNDLPLLINTFPTTASVGIAKDRYIKSSPSYTEIISATKQYPEITNNYENNFLDLILNCENALDFKNRYPASTFFKRAYLNAYKTDNQQINTIKKLDNSLLTNIKLEIPEIAKETDIIKQNFFISRYSIENPESIDDVISIYDKYSSINYVNKNPDLIKAFHSVADKNYDEGDYIIWLIKNLSNRVEYPTLTVSNREIHNFIEILFKNEIVKNVIITSKNYISSRNDQFELWKKNNTYAAGIVGEKDIAYILYGTINNKSKYTLPIELIGSGNLISTTRLQSDGTLVGNLLELGYEVIGNSFRINHGSKSASFYIPQFPTQTSGSYAIRIDFHNAWGLIRGGINFTEKTKIINEESLNFDIEKRYSAFIPSTDIINKQLDNLMFAKYGLPSNSLTDLWNGGDVDNDKWKEKYRILEEERRRRRLEEEQIARNARAIGICGKFVKTYEFTYKDVKYIADVYRNLNTTGKDEVKLFYFSGDDRNKPGYYHFDKGKIYDDIEYGGQTKLEALNKFTNCK